MKTNQYIPGPTLKNTDKGIKIDYESLEHETTSYIIGANRNHQFFEPNLVKKLKKYGSIKPRFAEGRKLYRLGHGPTDGRLDEPHSYMTGYHFTEWWGKTGPYPYDDLRFGLKESLIMDADLTVVINYGSGTPKEAGELVSYLNKKDDEKRNQHGDDPWNVEYFEMGNEVTWDQQVGHDPYTLSPEIYAERAKKFAREMRANSDIPIKIGMVGSIDGTWKNSDWPNDESDDRMHDISTIVDIMGPDVDFFIYHGYPNLGKEGLSLMAQNQWFKNKLTQKVIPTLNEARKRNDIQHPLKIANSEFFSARYGFEHNQDVLEGLYTTDSIITALLLDLEMAVNFCFSSNNRAQSLFFYEDDPQQPTPVFQVQKLIAEKLGDYVITASDNKLPVIKYEQLAGNQLDKISYVATKHNQGHLSLLLLNRAENSEVKIPVDPGVKITKAVLTSLVGDSYNSKDMKKEIKELENLREVTIPGTSVNILELKI